MIIESLAEGLRLRLSVTTRSKKEFASNSKSPQELNLTQLVTIYNIIQHCQREQHLV